MPLRFTCPACGGTLQAPDSMAGQAGACTFCHARIIAPTATGGIAALIPPSAPGAAPPGAPVTSTPGAASPGAAWTMAPRPGAIDAAGSGLSVPPSLETASFGKRLIAFLLDSAALWVIAMATAPVIMLLTPWKMPDLTTLLQGLSSVPLEGATPDYGAPLPNPALLALSYGINLLWNGLIQWLYFALFESSSTQATPGKMLVGIRVTDLHGRRLGFGRATARTMAKGFSTLLCFIGYLMAAFSERRQALHDILAQTLVLNR